LDQLGSGQFGEVCKALWSISGATKELAIKTLRAELPEEEKVRFLQEAAIMGQFSHPNIVKLYGVVTVGDPVSSYNVVHVLCFCR
jgi:serine/threonine protein kinase